MVRLDVDVWLGSLVRVVYRSDLDAEFVLCFFCLLSGARCGWPLSSKVRRPVPVKPLDNIAVLV